MSHSVVYATLDTTQGDLVNSSYQTLDVTEYEKIENFLADKIRSRESISEPIKYDSFHYNDAFICTMQTNEGVYEYAYNINGNVHYKKFIDGILQHASTTPESPTYSLSTATLDQIDVLLLEYDKNKDFALLNHALSDLGCYAILDNSALLVRSKDYAQSSRASSTVYGGMDELLTAFPAQNARLSSTIKFRCTPLAQDKYVNVRDNRTNYVETNNKFGSFLAGAAVVQAAASVWANPKDFLNWIGLSISVTALPYAISVHNTIQAKAYHYRYGEIYDSTRKQYVTCTSEYGYDYFVVSKQSTTYRWGVEPLPINEMFSDAYIAYIASNAANAYNVAVERDGYWKF